MAGKSITISAADGGTFSGYLATPEVGSGPGIVLLQEIFGVNQSMRETADYFAEEGYVVLVPDLFWRIEPGIELGYDQDSFQKAFGLYGQFDVDQGVSDIGDAIKALREIERVTRDSKAYVQVDSYRTEEERELFLDWVLTAFTHDYPDGWKKLFDEAGYKGDYHWTLILGEDTEQ